MASEGSGELAELLRAAAAGELSEVYTSIPGRIVRYEARKRRADVKPLVMRAYYNEAGERIVESLPVIPNVPVIFPGAGGYRLTFPVVASDTNGTLCALHFAMVSLDKWLSGTGREVDPEVDHGHSITDAWAVPELLPFGSPLSSEPTDHATMGHDEGPQIHFRGDVITAGDEAGAEFASKANLVLERFEQLYNSIAVAGVVPNDGGAAFKQNLIDALNVLGWPASVAASQFKVK